MWFWSRVKHAFSKSRIHVWFWWANTALVQSSQVVLILNHTCGSDPCASCFRAFIWFCCRVCVCVFCLFEFSWDCTWVCAQINVFVRANPCVFECVNDYQQCVHVGVVVCVFSNLYFSMFTNVCLEGLWIHAVSQACSEHTQVVLKSVESILWSLCSQNSFLLNLLIILKRMFTKEFMSDYAS